MTNIVALVLKFHLSDVSFFHFTQVFVIPWYLEIDVFVTPERRKSGLFELKDMCEVSIDCAGKLNACIEYRDNSTTMLRWLSISESGQ